MTLIRILRLWILAGITLSQTTACSEEEEEPEISGACEYRDESKGTQAYGCYNSVGQNACTPTGLGQIHTVARDETHFHANKKCEDIGYTIYGNFQRWFATTDGSSPSSQGYFGGDQGGGSGDDSGAGGTGGDLPAVCDGEYAHMSDSQLDAYCGMAYAYRCLDGKPLSDPGVQANCENYNMMKEPGVPACKYCQ